MPSLFKAGVAKVNITPPVGFPQAGYAGRDNVSDFIDDELYSKALVLDDGETEIVVVTNDLIRVTPQLTQQVRTAVYEQLGIAGDHVLLCASHTHFGPVLQANDYLSSEIMAAFDETYVRELARKMIGAIRMAHDQRCEARIAVGKGSAPELAFNRRTRKRDGKVTMSWRYPTPEEAAELTFGPMDPDVGVLRIEDLHGKLMATLINFACHPVCGVDRMYAISADYPGHAMEFVERWEESVCLFSLGCAGNIVPIEREGNARRWIGTALGAETLKMLQWLGAGDRPASVGLSARRISVELPLKSPSPQEQAYQTTEVQALRMGEVLLVGLPGEVFVEFGLDIKQRLQAEHIFVLSLCNDGFHYVPTESAYPEGGYETDSSPLAPGAGEMLADAAVELAQSMM